MPGKSKRLRIMAGPNGSGKSTVLKEVRKNFYSGPFVNADEIEKSFREKKLLNLWSEYDLQVNDDEFHAFVGGTGKSWEEKALQEGSKINITSKEGILVVQQEPSPYDAALAADFVRHLLLKKGETFTFETVLSHPSKRDLLIKSLETGYKNYLYFICTVSPRINIERVKQRVQLSGHDVPEDRIEKRYYESLRILPLIIPLSYRVFLFDNSAQNDAPSIAPVAEIDETGNLLLHTSQVPWWVEQHVIQPLYL